MGTVLHDRAIVIQSETVLKAENWPGQEGGISALYIFCLIVNDTFLFNALFAASVAP
ncbi:unnamed protein product, partial [Staurois parvus]